MYTENRVKLISTDFFNVKSISIYSYHLPWGIKTILHTIVLDLWGPFEKFVDSS
jgi:hypothetical protein